MSWLFKTPAILKVINKNCLSPQLPSYNHIEFEGKSYAIKGDILNFIEDLPEVYDEINTYSRHKVLISGELTESKGCMPNPMSFCPCIKVESISLIK